MYHISRLMSQVYTCTVDQVLAQQFGDKYWHMLFSGGCLKLFPLWSSTAWPSEATRGLTEVQRFGNP